MCEAMTEPPGPETLLCCFWSEEPIPVAGEERDLEIGEWVIRVRILRVKDSTYYPEKKHVSMEVIG